VDFHEIKEGDVHIAAICKMCGTRMSARSAASTSHLIRLGEEKAGLGKDLWWQWH
jgi:hypothetical protein